MAETLLDKAEQNMAIAKTLFQSSLAEDEAYLNYVGYHLQQSIELALKYLLEQNGVEYPKTHDIDNLINIADANNVCLGKDENIREHSERYTMWESKTRYVLNYRLARKKIETGISEIEDYIKNIKSMMRVNEKTIDEAENPSKFTNVDNLLEKAEQKAKSVDSKAKQSNNSRIR